MVQARGYSGPERRDYPNGDGTLASLPAWARAIAVLGATGSVCLFLGFLIYAGAKSLPEMQKEISALIESNHAVETALRDHQLEAARMRRVMEQTCAGIAKQLKDDAREQRCYDQ